MRITRAHSRPAHGSPGVAPLILYVPGLRPKPPPSVHRHELLRCLSAGVNRVDPEVALQIREANRAFDIVSWTYDFYGEHRDVELDRGSIEQLLQRREASPRDVAEAGTLKRRAIRWLYRAADHLPFLIPQLADENLKLHLSDLRRYVTDDDDIASATRRQLKMPLRAAWKSGRPVLLLGHSMGSVIAWDALWEMSHESGEELHVDFITIGSPLGQRYIQRRLKGHGESGNRRYPTNIRRWVNLAAVGEMTAIDRVLRNDFAGMLDAGLVQEIRDIEIYNYFRMQGALNVHAEYGYLVNDATAAVVCQWWREVTAAAPGQAGEERVRPDPGSA